MFKGKLMKKVYPHYYSRFKCTAGQCKHNCCIGWEIDIDYSTMRKYLQMKGPMGERVRQHIAGSVLDGHIVMGEDGRCPFLTADNLCELILAKKEKSLCSICKMHPRFENDFADRREFGLGLTCEVACALILREQEPMRLIVEDDGRRKAVPPENKLRTIHERDALIALAQDRSLPVAKRMERILQRAHQTLPNLWPQEWAAVFLQLECMTEEWPARLRALYNGKVGQCRDEIALEQLLVYFIYRHDLVDYDGLEYQVPAFAVLSTRLISWICQSDEDVLEAARLYSSEVEYSDENVERLLELLERETEE